jgi:prepilin peptidase CpaA
MMGGVPATLCQWAGLGGLLLAAGLDIKNRVIPNELVLGVGLVGLTARVLTEGWWSGLSLLVAICVVIPLGMLARREIVGGGDAKMIAAATLLFSPIQVLPLLLAIALAGGVLALIYLAAFRAIRPAVASASTSRKPRAHEGWIASERSRVAAREPLPYGVAILAGAAFLLLREAFRCSFATSC